MQFKKMKIDILIPLLFGLAWTLFIASLLAWNLRNEQGQTLEIATQQARAFFQQVQDTRIWNAAHGGVYVPVDELTRPNPYLEDPQRDLVTINGLVLTKINPAFMTRKIASISKRRKQVEFSITSLNPLQPANTPKAWEVAAMQSFQRGKSEKFEIVQKKDGQKSFMYMAPLWVKKPCLKCHEKHGYREGDLRGGISISIPAEFLLGSQQRKIFVLGSIYAGCWLLGLGGLALGMNLINRKAREQRKAQISSLLLTAQEGERKRIGQELHDSIGQSLSAVKFSLEDSLQKIEKDVVHQDVKSLHSLVPRIQTIIEDVRRVVMDLWPSTLDDLGIIATISWFGREFEKIYSNIHIKKQITVNEHDVPEHLKIAIFRVMQEALNNIAKHSSADSVRLSLSKTAEEIVLKIEDNGTGVTVEDGLPGESGGRGFGILSMRERTELSGGSFSIVFIEGKGTCVCAVWPFMLQGEVLVKKS